MLESGVVILMEKVNTKKGGDDHCSLSLCTHEPTKYI